MKLFIEKHQFSPTEGGMGGGVDKLNDGWADIQMDGQKDKEMGIGTNKNGPTDPPVAMG